MGQIKSFFYWSFPGQRGDTVVKFSAHFALDLSEERLYTQSIVEQNARIDELFDQYLRPLWQILEGRYPNYAADIHKQTSLDAPGGLGLITLAIKVN